MPDIVIRWSIPLVVVACALAAAASPGAGATDASTRGGAACPSERPDPVHEREVMRALRAKEDVWGNELLAAPSGPTFERARRFLSPLLRAKAAGGASLTSSGIHYVPFSGPVGPAGAQSMALHVADGSQVLSQRSSGRSLTVSVGPEGREVYGSCLARLATSHLAEGYLPVLETGYVDSAGVRYRQESFATRIPQTSSLVSLVALTADTRNSEARARLRFTSSESGLARDGETLVKDGDAYLAFSPGGEVDGSTVTFRVTPGTVRTAFVVYLNAPASLGHTVPDRAMHEVAKAALARHWGGRLADGMTIEVPERIVMDADRSLLIQNLALTWRYSVGNPYQQFSFPEGVDVAQTMAARGFLDVARRILLESFRTPLTRYPNWKMGQKLVGSALYYRLTRDSSYVDAVTPALRGYVRTLGRQIRANPRGMLARERFSSDIKDSVYGLHSQAVVWQGLRTMAPAWASTGHRDLAAEARRLAVRLGTGLRAAVRTSQRELPDGSLFVPMRLLDGERPYESVIESRAGGYWNLVAPYAFASGLFAPGTPRTTRVLRYMLLHGSRLLGLVRAGAYSLYGLTPVYPISGVNPVYGLNAARFFADNDRPDQLVLTLYGQLAAGMAPGTFISGEGLSVAPLTGEVNRSMYLPPNGASNGSFLETLRLMLVHERRDSNGDPRGIDLAYATPRAWLGTGKRIVVRHAPTSFGAISFTISASNDEIHVAIDAPERSARGELSLRLRLPHGKRIRAVTLGGRPYSRVDVRGQTIDLSGRAGRLELVVRTA